MENGHTKQDLPRRSVIHSAAWNYAGYAYQIILNFGLTAYVVRRISVTEYGLFLLVMSLSATMNLLDLGISGVLVQNYVHAAKNHGKEYLNDLVSTALLALTVLGFIGAGILGGLALSLPGPFRIPHALLHAAVSVFLIAALLIQVRLPTVALRQAFQAYERFDRINQLSLVTSTLQVILSAYAVYAGFGVIGLALVQFIVAVLQIMFFLLALPLVVPGLRFHIFRFHPDLLASLVAEGKWAFLANLTGYMVELATWGILGSFGSMTEVALYGIAFKGPNQLWNLADRGADVLLPVLSGYAAEGDYVNLSRVFLTTQQLMFGVMLPFVILGALFSDSVLELWVGKQYLSSSTAMRWLLIAVLAHAIAYSSDLMLYACGKVKRAAWIYVVGGGFTCGAALLLVPRYGAAGMAASLAVSLLVLDCGWFTLEACKFSRTSVSALARSLVSGLGLPVLVLAAETVAILSMRSILSPLWTVVAATAGGAIYFVIWGLRTALPLYRNRVEIIV